MVYLSRIYLPFTVNYFSPLALQFAFSLVELSFIITIEYYMHHFSSLK